MDDIAQFNKERWEELAQSDIQYARPMLDLDEARAKAFLDPHNVMGDVKGCKVLCLGSGGGQQSAAFGLLAADVTVVDISETQLERDRLAARHYGFPIRVIQSDMRRLQNISDNTFDIVYHAFSINFVPDIHTVLDEVVRILRKGGLYRVEWANPFTQLVDESSWNGKGYLLEHAYVDGRDASLIWKHWDVVDRDGRMKQVVGPHEYVHTLSKMINCLISRRLIIWHIKEDMGETDAATPDSWQHYMNVAAPYLTVWARYEPDITFTNESR